MRCRLTPQGLTFVVVVVVVLHTHTHIWLHKILCVSRGQEATHTGPPILRGEKHTHTQKQCAFSIRHSTSIFSIISGLSHLHLSEFSSPPCSNKSLRPRPRCNYIQGCSFTALSWPFFVSLYVWLSLALFLSRPPQGSQLCVKEKHAFTALYLQCTRVRTTGPHCIVSHSGHIISILDMFCFFLLIRCVMFVL